MKVAVVKLASAMLGVSLLAGCAGIRDHRGAVLDSELVTAVQVGVDNKESVEKTLGRPTFVSNFTPNDWYYLSRDTTTLAFRSPRVVDQTVLHVQFDAAGNVAAVNRMGPELIANIDPSDARTPTLGRERSFFEELFGNIGSIGSGPVAGGRQQ